ncbi:ankyrin repeat domain-containing protein [Spongiivirga sp. MCCC 1A20706]|uniref:ankyrin repeat domain-containing protein n=1 Tax=Spongiivirga sp. MCCC 1A20706 TaxID=3160963 RepID=UPI00397736DC
MIVLLIKASLIIGVVLLFYKLVIEKESFFATNRVYLILGLLLAFSIPFISIPKLVENQGVVASLIEPETASQPLVTGTKPTTIQQEESVDAIPPKKPSKESSLLETDNISGSERSLMDWIWIIYIFGVGVLCLNLIAQIVGLLVKVIQSNDKIKDLDGIIVNSTKIKEPCSFFNYIFINPEQYEFEIYEQIIAHEKIHVKKRHSIDLLLAEIAVILLWFNPFIWLFRKEVEKNVEYQTDHLVLDTKKAERDSYQMNLLKIATFNKPLAITTNYNQSLIKKRILKMNSKKSNPYSYWKYAFTMPLFFAVLLFLNKPLVAASQNTIESDFVEETNAKTAPGVDIAEKQETNPIVNQDTDNPNIAAATATSECKELLEAIRTDDMLRVKALINTNLVNCIEENPGYENMVINGHSWRLSRPKSPLFAAAKNGNLEIAKLLVANGADVSLIVPGDGTALITAAEYGHLDFIKYLVSKGADINKTFPNQGNALITASGRGHLDVMKYLVSEGADVNYYSPNQGNALIAAARCSNVDAVKFLVSKGLDVSFISPSQGNALIVASGHGRSETVKYLVSQGVEIDKISPNQGTALIAASNNGQLETVKFLIDQGAEIDKISSNQGTALIAAANNGHLQTVAYLVAKGADINKYAPNQGSAVNAAANNGHMTTMKFLIKQGASVNVNTDSHGSALISAAKNGINETVSYLIDQGADVNAQTHGSGSALIAASKNGHNHTIELLLSKGANINGATDGSGSALTAAANNGLIDTVKFLLDKGADIDGQTDGSGSALSNAAKNGMNDVIILLIDRGANIDLQNDGSGSALNNAAKNGHLETVKLLVEKGANVNLYSAGQGTALAQASKNGYKKVVDYLLSKGAQHIYGN